MMENEKYRENHGNKTIEQEQELRLLIVIERVK